MDGNARWARKNSFSPKKGYLEGLNKIYEVIDICIDSKIKYLTLYTLSTENIKRSSINLIYEIMYNNFSKIYKKLSDNKKIRINIIGDKKNLPIKIIEILSKLESATKNNNTIILNIAFNYGSINELLFAIKKIISLSKNNQLKYNENLIFDNLYLSNVPEPDILIRTGGYKRLSNFLLLQLRYTELFFTDTLWPDISNNEINSIFNEYRKLDRKYGL